MSADPLADAIISIKNSDAAAKREWTFRPASTLLGEVLKVLQREEYIGDFEFVEENRKNSYKAKLLGKINNCRAIKPRYAVKKDDFEKFEKRYLPARDVGVLIVTTPNGVLTHREAKEKGTGGRLLAFVY